MNVCIRRSFISKVIVRTGSTDRQTHTHTGPIALHGPQTETTACMCAHSVPDPHQQRNERQTRLARWISHTISWRGRTQGNQQLSLPHTYSLAALKARFHAAWRNARSARNVLYASTCWLRCVRCVASGRKPSFISLVLAAGPVSRAAYTVCSALLLFFLTVPMETNYFRMCWSDYHHIFGTARRHAARLTTCRMSDQWVSEWVMSTAG